MTQETYVYMLSTHDEYGAEDVRATLWRESVPDMLEEYFKPNPNVKMSDNCKVRWDEQCVEDRKTLAELLAKDDQELLKNGGKFNLGRGWGGIQFHVVWLYK